MEKDGNNVVQYSGKVSGSYSGSFEMTVNFEESRVKGTFEGGSYEVNVKGSIEDREISAEGSVIGQQVKISGQVSEDRSTIGGEWKAPSFASGEWNGTED
ncbi:hypothetical protein AKJ57_04635 [candidate division MSBL1 archaeon SCGC-AAA259A05]|uniref:Uncharacterized protein n=1 Tax=candidate division MSBL1 archaeon SCGC-AAA259A05 TaxID=1698259 RepID=A0A133U6X9_9EURY|nr:hypothetical protein AKJ57_04635 [candidate division MSBL1 archaeon SCGC-AAA259A05]